jgi:hypothetical protein
MLDGALKDALDGVEFIVAHRHGDLHQSSVRGAAGEAGLVKEKTPLDILRLREG